MRTRSFRGFFRCLRTRLTPRFPHSRTSCAEGWGVDPVRAESHQNRRKLSKSAQTVDELLQQFGELAAIGDSVGLEELRGRVVHHLKRSDKRIVVLVDDIDRLDKQETHILFRIVKACADFPNFCYVLAFDDAAVARAVGERYGAGDLTSGHAFLEKIIQVPLKLPARPRKICAGCVSEQVDQVREMTAMKLTADQAREFVMSFDRGVEIRLTTPRAVKRFTNGLRFAVPPLLGETHPVDLLLVEALRRSIQKCTRSCGTTTLTSRVLMMTGTRKQTGSLVTSNSSNRCSAICLARM